MPNYVDYYGRARRQGASTYMAHMYETYVHAAYGLGLRPLPCNRWLAAVDISDTDTAIARAHGNDDPNAVRTLVYRVTGTPTFAHRSWHSGRNDAGNGCACGHTDGGR